MSLRWLALVLLLLGAASLPMRAQSIIRVGVIDQQDSPITRGAQLAAAQINAQGGIRGADGTPFTIKVVATPPDNMTIAAANMAQANVIAILLPASWQTFSDLQPLLALDLPMLTDAPGDSVLLQDSGGRLFRSAAPELTRNRALAAYLVNSLGARSIITVQLDAASTASLIGFAAALSELGVGASNIFYDESRMNLTDVVLRIMSGEPDAVGLYGPPLMAAQVYSQLRRAGYAGALSYGDAADSGFADFVPAELLPGVISATNWSFAAEDAISQRFVLDYVQAYGSLPGSASAAAHDALQLLSLAFQRPGRLAENLAAISGYQGVQGKLTPASLPPGEISGSVMITRINENGSPQVVARYQGSERMASAAGLSFATPTPAPTATPAGYNLIIQSAVQNVRSGPGTNYPVIGQLTSGTQARVLGASADFSWLVIEHRGQWGWLAAYLVDAFGNQRLVPIIPDPATPAPPATATSPPPATADLVVINAYPGRITLDQQAVINVVVRNQGRSAAGAFAIASSLQPGGQYVGVNLPSLAGGQITTAQLYATLRGATGPQSVIIVADLNEQVIEGPAGEANNKLYHYSYIADRALSNSGQWTTASGTLDLDGGGVADLSWSGADLAALNGGSLALLPAYAALRDLHYDAIQPGMATSGILSAEQLRGAIIGIIMADGSRAAAQVLDATRNGIISLEYRAYR